MIRATRRAARAAAAMLFAGLGWAQRGSRRFLSSTQSILCRAWGVVRSPIAVFLLGFASGVLANYAWDAYGGEAQRREVLAPVGYVAYLRAGDVYVAGADWRAGCRLTVGACCYGIQWSPEGRRLAVVGCPVGSHGVLALWVIDFDKGLAETWASGISASGFGQRVRWADRTDTIAFDYYLEADDRARSSCVALVRRRDGQYSTCYATGCYAPVLDVDGDLYAVRLYNAERSDGCLIWQLVRCTATTSPSLRPACGVLADTNQECFEDAGYAFEFPAISPDGLTIALRTRWNAGGQLWLCDIYGERGPRRASTLEDVIRLECSPASSWLLVRVQSESSAARSFFSHNGVYIVDAASAQHRVLVTNSPDYTWRFWDQCWSPTGCVLVGRERWDETVRNPLGPVLEAHSIDYYLVEVSTGDALPLPISPGVEPRLQPVPSPLGNIPMYHLDRLPSSQAPS